jgi:ABC-type transporter MlaC component
LRINFTIDDNYLAQPGPKEFFVVITDPSGKVVTYSNEDVLITRDGVSQPFTAKVSVNYEGGKSMPVSFDWKNDKDFAEGNYKIAIFNNGFKIGESTRTLKKGGLF